MAKRLYRVCRDMRYKSGTVPPGTLVWLDKAPETMEKLLSLGIIAPVRLPPWDALPGWEKRAPQFQMEGINDIEEFLQWDSVDLAVLLEYSIETINMWKEELTNWLTGKPAPQ